MSVLPEKFSYRVICGRTGSGKSRLLFALGQDGRQVLDLEGLAAHRGSVLGDLPGEPQPSQKYFESCIWQHLSQFDPTRPVFVEAESKKVGRLRVPERLIERMRESPCIEVDTPHSLRVRLLCEEYDHLITDNDLLFAKLDCLKELHSTARIDAWKSLAMSRSWDAFVADMLVDHYDPAYARSMFKNYVHAGDATVLPVNDISTEGFLNLARALPH